MSAIYVTQPLLSIPIFREKERGIAGIRSILAENAVHRTKQASNIIQCQHALTTQDGLKARHQQSGGNALPGDVADCQAKIAAPQVQEIEVVAAKGARWLSQASVIQGVQLWLLSRKEPRLNLTGKLPFDCCVEMSRVHVSPD